MNFIRADSGRFEDMWAFDKKAVGSAPEFAAAINDETEDWPIVCILKAATIVPALGKILDFSAIDARRIAQLLGLKWMACNCLIDLLGKLRTLEAPSLQNIAKALGRYFVKELMERLARFEGAYRADLGNIKERAFERAAREGRLKEIDFLDGFTDGSRIAKALFEIPTVLAKTERAS